MSHRSLAALATAAIFVLAACSSSTTSSAASAAAPSIAGGPVCNQTSDAGAVAVNIADFVFQPENIAAKTGQVIAFTNSGSAPHSATLDSGQCTTANLNAGKSDGLVFTKTGTYPFHCAIHAKMTGTIVIS